MIQLRNLHVQSTLVGILVTLAVVALISYTNASASPMQQAEEGQTVTVTGTAGGWTSGNDTIDINDDETLDLTPTALAWGHRRTPASATIPNIEINDSAKPRTK